jgi:DNA-binding transcriptional ArsR family regulator
MLAVPVFSALADDTRRRIVEALAEDERSAGELVELFPISQPAVSRHLRVLREAGLIEATAAGKQRIYRLRPDALTEVSAWADTCTQTWAQRLDGLGRHLDRISEVRRHVN